MRDSFDMFDDHAIEAADAGEITIDLVLHFEGVRSINVSEAGTGKVITLPRSKIRDAQTGRSVVGSDRRKLAIISVTMPEWLAIDRGLV